MTHPPYQTPKVLEVKSKRRGKSVLYLSTEKDSHPY